MRPAYFVILACLGVLLGVPLLVQPQRDTATAGRSQAQVIIITPHNEQIRYEFKRGFERWHLQRFGEPVTVIYNVPGGTSEIRKLLESQFIAALWSGREPGGDADLVFGGGTFEHSQLKRGVQIAVNGHTRQEPITTAVAFSDQWLASVYGENRIADMPLYDPDKCWFGTALSGFGIVYNNDVLQTLGVATPARWADLCDPRLQGWIALVNPNQSGSITTAFEAILKSHGWEEGWRILRRAGANARYFSAASLKPPIDVSQGNAAMGICIDFLGRFQAQALRQAGDPLRIAYIDPIGGSTIDADPISMLRNAPNPVHARRFIEFCLSEPGQALWQLPRRSQSDAGALGPEQFELRRLPIVRSIYASHFDRFIDRVNPFDMARPVQYPDSNFRDFIAPMFAAMAMDSHDDLEQAWRVLHDRLMRAGESDAIVARMMELFDAMPQIAGPGGERISLSTAARLAEVRNGWLRGGWSEHGLWHPQSSPADQMRRDFGEFFRSNYRQIIQLADTNSP